MTKIKRKYIFVVFLISAILIVVFFSDFLSKLSSEVSCQKDITYFKVEGNSLEPIIKNNEVKEVDLNLCGGIKKGDFILFKIGDKKYIKQATALPGEKVEIIGDEITLSDRKISSHFLTYLLESNNNQLPENAYILLGLKSNSIDSRRLGYIFKDQILGKVLR